MSLPRADTPVRSTPAHQALHGGRQAHAERADAVRAAPTEALVPAGTKAHKVVPGDTLNSIARQHQTTAAKLYELNPNLDPARLPRTLAQAGDHWDVQYLRDVDTVYVPDPKAGAAADTLHQMAREFSAQALRWAAQGPMSSPADVAVQQAAQDVNAIPAGPERAEAIAEQAHEIEQSHGHDAAVAFVARVVSTDPQGFGASITAYDMSGGHFDAATKTLLAEGVAKAYSEVPASPYTSPSRLAASLIDGMSDSMLGWGATSTLLSEIVGGTGNQALQADFVRSGLYQAMENYHAMEDEAPIYWGPTAALIASLASATRGSGAAAQEVIRFAEQFDMPFTSNPGTKGPESMRVILDLFSITSSPRPDGATENGFITFMEAAVSAQGGLGNQQSLTLFLAVAGASTDGTGLLEMDGPGGKADPAGTALTSQLFQQYFERWAADPALKLVIGGDIAHSGIESSPYPGYDFNRAFQTFFKEALLDPNEDGAYRSELLGFVTDTVFRAFDPASTLVQSMGADDAATLAGNLLGLLESSQVSLYGDLRGASEQQQRLLTLLSVVSVAAGGAGVATLATSTLAKVLVAGLVEAAKSGGRITAEALAAQGLDRDMAEVVAAYANGELSITQAFEGSDLFRQLEAAGLGADELQAFADHVQSTIGHGGYTLAEAITDAINVLDNDVPLAVKDRLAEIQRQMQQGIEHQRKAAGE